MINAKEELKNAIQRAEKTVDDILAFKIVYTRGTLIEEPPIVEISGKGPLTNDDWKSLDFDYDDGYGIQYLYGLVLFNDNSWLERSEYDGSEWWEYKKVPTIKEVLNF